MSPNCIYSCEMKQVGVLKKITFSCWQDPNRNFDILHGRVGSSNDPCQDTFHGETPFSEQESKAVRDVTNELVGRYCYLDSIFFKCRHRICPHSANAFIGHFLRKRNAQKICDFVDAGGSKFHSTEGMN